VSNWTVNIVTKTITDVTNLCLKQSSVSVWFILKDNLKGNNQTLV
jgi:hypothetical protein